MTANWYALRSKPRKEEVVWKQMEFRGFETFYPRLRVRPTNPRARKIVPYFPGYLFVRVDLASVGPSTFQWMPYAIGLVSFGGEPATVPDALVLAIRRRARDLQDVGGELFDGLNRGDPVVIREGPFEGYKAIFDIRLSGDERVRVLMAMLNGKHVPVELSIGHLERKNRI